MRENQIEPSSISFIRLRAIDSALTKEVDASDIHTLCGLFPHMWGGGTFLCYPDYVQHTGNTAARSAVEGDPDGRIPGTVDVEQGLGRVRKTYIVQSLQPMLPTFTVDKNGQGAPVFKMAADPRTARAECLIRKVSVDAVLVAQGS